MDENLQPNFNAQFEDNIQMHYILCSSTTADFRLFHLLRTPVLKGPTFWIENKNPMLK